MQTEQQRTTHYPASSIAWTDALQREWWQRMGRIFGRAWIEQFGDAPPRDWREEMSTWSVELAAAVLVHYRRAGLQYGPNLSQVGKLARELRPSLQPPVPTPRHDPSAAIHACGRERRKVSEFVERYMHDNRGTSLREASMAYLTKRGIVHTLPEAVLAEARAHEAAMLQHAATKNAAKAKDIESALEEADEREAIQAESR